MTDNIEIITPLDETLDAEELAAEQQRILAAQERAERNARQGETLQEIAALFDNGQERVLTNYGIIREAVVANNDTLVLIGSTDKVVVLTAYERTMYTDELQRVANKLAERHHHKLSEWSYSYGVTHNIAICIHCGEPVVQKDKEMPKGASVLNQICEKYLRDNPWERD